jgi:hypothetical protein
MGGYGSGRRWSSKATTSAYSQLDVRHWQRNGLLAVGRSYVCGTKRWLTLDQDNTQLRLKYIPEFERVISHKKTAVFFQIDRRVSMLIELQLASQVPLVKP